MRRLWNLCKDRTWLGCAAKSLCARCLSTQKILRPKKKSSQALQEPANAVLDQFPTLGKKKKSSDGIYIIHDDVAGYMEFLDRFISHLGVELTNDDVTIIEANPGPGILTRALLKAGAKNLRVCEPKEEYHHGLFELQSSVSPDRLKVIKTDFFNLSKIAYSDKRDLTNDAEKMFEGIPVKSWHEPTPPCVVLGTLPPAREKFFLNYLSFAVIETDVMYSLGRVQLLLFISYRRLQRLIAKPGTSLHIYRSHSILSQIFFDIELLGKEERGHFYPHASRTLTRTTFDDEHLFLVRITPKENLMHLLPSPDALHELYFFIKQNCYKRTDFVISKLESWIPNCGVRLIKNGFSIFTQFGDLSPDQFLHLFIEFSSWPEYPSCAFQLALTSYRQEYDSVFDEGNDNVV